MHFNNTDGIKKDSDFRKVYQRGNLWPIEIWSYIQ